MVLSVNQLEKRRQVAGIFIVFGLVIEALCLIWSTPIAFVIFVAIGGLLMFVGVVLYLYSLVFNLDALE
jgi:predicted membrane channel-forming protein YqfA (hemolysin III family)